MRMAKCRGLTKPVTIVGSIAGVTMVGPVGQPGDPDYHPGWEGDLDQVIGETAATLDAQGRVLTPAKALTIAEALGPDLLVHFDERYPQAPAGGHHGGRGGRLTDSHESSAPSAQE